MRRHEARRVANGAFGRLCSLRLDGADMAAADFLASSSQECEAATDFACAVRRDRAAYGSFARQFPGERNSLGDTSARLLRPPHLPVLRFSRSRTALSLATRVAFSNLRDGAEHLADEQGRWRPVQERVRPQRASRRGPQGSSSPSLARSSRKRFAVSTIIIRTRFAAMRLSQTAKCRACSTEKTSAEPSLKELEDRIANTAKPAADAMPLMTVLGPIFSPTSTRRPRLRSNRTASVFSCARRRGPPQVSPCAPPASPSRRLCASSPTPDPAPSAENVVFRCFFSADSHIQSMPWRFEV